LILSKLSKKGEEKMKHLFKSVGFISRVLLVLIFLSFMVHPAFAAPPGGQLNITEVQVDLTNPSNPKFTIFGADLDVGPGPLSVTFGDQNALNIISETATLIIAEMVLTPPQELPDGDYLLTVSRGIGQSQNDEYDLTIGAVGPQGLEGADGAVGPQGPAGPTGPQGDQGLQGVAGNDGAQGVAGNDGAPGVAGADGATGPAGPTGPQGPIGLTGSTGSTGATGPAGSQGIQGIPGPAGALDASSIYRRSSLGSGPMPPGNLLGAAVACDDGNDVGLGGGCETGWAFELQDSHITPNFNGKDTQRCRWRNDIGINIAVGNGLARITCLSVP
jgi:collagen triple helix repeat protein